MFCAETFWRKGVIGDNAKYYPKDYLDDVNETWWMKTIHQLGLELCVNNSWSGSCVSTLVDDENKAACMNRAIQLHNDQQGKEPDIIVLMIGGNDALKGFAEMARCIIAALQ